ncbi:MAG TPA: dihydrofolate reductase [Flavisolibacter sp.]|nr:dihydrofolate reductase [Flavisolibacter sp.]
MIVSLLLAASENNVIGKDNQLPWHLPEDLKFFKNLTWGLPILMGRKTFDSIGKPLPGRKSIVITRDKEWKHEGVATVHSIEEAIASAESFGAKEIFVIGGAEIFKTSLPIANRIYLTRIHHRFDGDVFFPEISTNEWNLVSNRYCAAEGKNTINHTYQVWERKMPVAAAGQQ